VTTTLEHFKSHKMPPMTKMLVGLAIAPTMQAIIVDSVTFIDPQLAAIIGDNREPVMACPVDSHARRPAHSKVITSTKAWPSAPRVTIVHGVFPASLLWPAILQIRAPAALRRVEDILPEEAMAIGGYIALANSVFMTTGTHNNPTVSCVRPVVPKEHPSMTTTLKHLKSHQMPPSAYAPSGHTIAPTMQAVVVDCVTIVNPQLASIIRVNAEVVSACPEDPEAPCPAHCEVISPSKTRPSTTCVAIVHDMFPTSHIRPATRQSRASTSLTEVEHTHKETTMVIPWTVTRTA
jgi:hypothetical protein